MGLYLRHPASFGHDTGGHPENAGRLRAIEATLEEQAWLGLELVEAPPATREQLERAHSPGHIDAVEALCSRGGGMLDLDTVASAGSWEAALRSAGGAIHAVERLLGEGGGFAFCGLRPPGHHAERSRAMGFCLFNNIAVACAHGLRTDGVERVLILDWDVHHGNGTESIFKESDRALYVSIHESPLYPGTGAAVEAGSGEGLGFTVNLPVPAGSGPEEFLALVQHVVVPLGRAHDPDLILISAGYDAHSADPLASCTLDEGAYADMAASIRRLGTELGAPVVACLEGGYDPVALSDSVAATIRALAGEGEARAAAVEFAAPYRERVARFWDELA